MISLQSANGDTLEYVFNEAKLFLSGKDHIQVKGIKESVAFAYIWIHSYCPFKLTELCIAKLIPMLETHVSQLEDDEGDSKANQIISTYRRLVSVKEYLPMLQELRHANLNLIHSGDLLEMYASGNAVAETKLNVDQLEMDFRSTLEIHLALEMDKYFHGVWKVPSWENLNYYLSPLKLACKEISKEIFSHIFVESKNVDEDLKKFLLQFGQIAFGIHDVSMNEIIFKSTREESIIIPKRPKITLDAILNRLFHYNWGQTFEDKPTTDRIVYNAVLRFMFGAGSSVRICLKSGEDEKVKQDTCLMHTAKHISEQYSKCCQTRIWQGDAPVSHYVTMLILQLTHPESVAVGHLREFDAVVNLDEPVNLAEVYGQLVDDYQQNANDISRISKNRPELDDLLTRMQSDDFLNEISNCSSIEDERFDKLLRKIWNTIDSKVEGFFDGQSRLIPALRHLVRFQAGIHTVTQDNREEFRLGLVSFGQAVRDRRGQ